MKKHGLAAFFFLAFLIILFPILAAASDSVPETIISAAQSVVRVEANYSDSVSLGSGFVVKSDGETTLIATNYHVVEGSPYAVSVWIGTDEKVTASVLLFSSQKDLCVLKLAYPISLPALSLKADAVSQGDAVYAVGFPAAADALSDTEARESGEATITDGIVSAVRQVTVTEYGSPVKLLQINAAINSGNSGGPLFNSDGVVVGINTYGTFDSQGIFGAIEIGELLTFMEDGGVAYAAAQTSGFAWYLGAIIAAIAAAGIAAAILILRKGKRKEKRPGSDTLLNAVLNRGRPYSPREAVTLLAPVAETLAEMHEKGKPHLQASPDCILIRRGTAELLPEPNGEAERYSSGFTPPEVYRNAGGTGASDVYSYCALLLFAVTGKTPENALSRAEAEPTSQGEGAEAILAEMDEELARIVAKGMSLAPEYRYASMRGLILALERYGASASDAPEAFPASDAISALPAASPDGRPEKYSGDGNSAAKRTKRRKGRVLKLVALCLAGALVLLSATYYICYRNVVSLAEEGKFTEAQDHLFFSYVTYLHDRNLLRYISAGVLMEERQYQKAYAGFNKLEGYRDSENMAYESLYRMGAQLADSNDFDGAIAEYAWLEKFDYKDSAEMLLNTYYRQAAYKLYELGEYEEAYKILRSLSNKGYEKAEDMLQDAAEVVYENAQEAYRSENYIRAKELFTLIDPYMRSSDYLMLYQALIGDLGSDPSKITEEVVDLFDFENAPSVLVSNTDIACEFLLGTWKSSGGSYYFKTIESDEEGYTYECSYNLPWLEGDRCIIKDGVYYVETKSGEEKEWFRFTVITPNSMDVYCYKNNKTYTLYRK